MVKITLFAALMITSRTYARIIHKHNPFTLAYEGAVAECIAGKINIHPVTYKLNGLSAFNLTDRNNRSLQKIYFATTPRNLTDYFFCVVAISAMPQ